ncbi:MAG TPA: DUF1080 domain-containing protein [Armatimonadota bacterium]|jgi:hypothetical protein
MSSVILRRGGIVVLSALVAGSLAPRLFGQAEPAANPAPAAPVIPFSPRPPAGAVLLFTGKADQMKGNWYSRGSQDPSGWEVDAAGVATPNKHDITSKQEFGDCFLHAEFQEPMEGHGNAGIGLQGRYEVQIMNSFGAKAENTACGAFYSQTAPRTIASKPAGQWQTYDIIFRAPRFDDQGKVVEQARATVFQNGILVQNNAEFKGPTGIQYGEFRGEAKTGPIVLQGDHDVVKYRNVWLVPM